MLDAIIFDVDGTIWDSTEQVSEAWTETVQNHASKSFVITPEEFRKTFGKTMDVFCSMILAPLSPKEQSVISDLGLKNEVTYLKKHPGVLYPGVYETLQQLSKKVPLYIVSNCQCGYVETCIETTGLKPFISGHLCNGETDLPKAETLHMLMSRYDLKDVVYVGDTSDDAGQCKKAGIPFVWASYGFGQYPEAERTIHSMSELPEVLGL